MGLRWMRCGAVKGVCVVGGDGGKAALFYLVFIEDLGGGVAGCAGEKQG